MLVSFEVFVERWLPLVMAVVFVSVGLVLPMVRLWVRHRVFGLVLHRREDPTERLVAVFFGLTLALVAGWGALAAALPWPSLGIWTLPEWGPYAGVALAVLGLGVVAWSQAAMGPSLRIGLTDEPTALVTDGIYARVRHPIYTGMLAIAAGR
jgi:protein-S-isoprenylcysteine O-methyltransferase Ste14